MELQLDHIVHFIEGHPMKAIEEWKQLHFHAVMGGSHEKWGTNNSLLYAGSSYIEFLAIENDLIAQSSDNPLIRQLVSDLPNGEGLGTICFRTANIMKVKIALEEKGCGTTPIFAGSRKRQDGTLLKWKMLFIDGESSLPYPFFIEWEQNDRDRLKELEVRGMFDQKLKKNSIQAIYYACHNAEEEASKWSHLFQFPLIKTGVQNDYSSKVAVIRCKTTDIIFCQPLKKEGIVHDTLIQRGEKPFAIEFDQKIHQNSLSLFGSQYQ